MATESIFHNVSLDSDDKVSRFLNAAEKSFSSARAVRKRSTGRILSDSNKIKNLISANVARFQKTNNYKNAKNS